jgi:hypothetical protein
MSKPMTVSKEQRIAEARKCHHMPAQRRAEAAKRAEVRASRTPMMQLTLIARRGGAPTCKEAVRIRAAMEDKGIHKDQK